MNKVLGKYYTNIFYISLMSLAAIITLAKGFTLATVLDVNSFGFYITTISFAQLIGTFLSLGQNEKTTKTFPRYWLSNKLKTKIIDESDKIIKNIVLRVSIGVILVSITKFFLNESVSLNLLFFALVAAASIALNALNASAIRATGHTNIISISTMFRSLLNIVLSIFGAFFFNWQGAIIGETISGISIAFFTRKIISKEITRSIAFENKETNLTKHVVTSTEKSHLWLFYTNLLIAIPSYMDRTLIASILGVNAAGTYGFLMLFITGAATFVGIIIQKIGPQIIKMEQLGATINAQIKYALRWVLLIWAICLLGMLTAMIFLKITPANFYFIKFNLTLSFLSIITIICLLQVTVIADFILISRNNEHLIFKVNFWYILLFSINSIIFIILHLNLLSFLWLLALTKLAQLLIQVQSIYTMKDT